MSKAHFEEVVAGIDAELRAFGQFFASIQSDGVGLTAPERALVGSYLLWVAEGRPANKAGMGAKAKEVTG